MSIQILLADDHEMFRNGLRLLIEQEDDLSVVAEAENGYEAIAKAAEMKPDMVIMDIGMPGLNGAEATRRILENDSDQKVIALSMHSEQAFVSNMLNAGAQGYVEKSCAFNELVRAIRAVMQDEVYLSSEITGILIQNFLHPVDTDESQPFELTPREREVLQAVSEGLSTREIAEQLHISVKTVETHRQHIMEKLNLHSIAELTKYAIRNGLTTLNGS